MHSPPSLFSSPSSNCYACDLCVVGLEGAAVRAMPLFRAQGGPPRFRPPAPGTQAAVYHGTALHAVRAALEGRNACVFAYGQTGSGKTYTLFGTPAHPGLATRTLTDLFGTLNALTDDGASGASTRPAGAASFALRATVGLSFLEVYRNEVFCLLSGKGPLRVRVAGEGVAVDELAQATVGTAAAAQRLLKAGLRRRRVGRTERNALSSRSHAILQIRVAQWRTNRSTHEVMEHTAKINLVDLAGSERQRTAGAQRGSLTDGIYINQSLTALSRVINDVACGAKFVNYRDSLLTMILKDSLGGNSKTFMIANISPIAENYEESCATLAYAGMVRRVRNRFTVNCTIHRPLSPLVINLPPGEEGCQELSEKMKVWMRYLRGNFTSHHDDSHSLSGPPPDGEIPFVQNKLNPLAPTCQKEGKVYDTFIDSPTSGTLRAPLIIFSNHMHLSPTGAADPVAEGSSGPIRIIALINDSLELDLAQLIQSSGLLALSKSPKDVDTAELVTTSVVDQQLMVQNEVDRAMGAQVEPPLERTLFEADSPESSCSFVSTREKDEVCTVAGGIISPHRSRCDGHNPLSSKLGSLNFKRASQDCHSTLFSVHFIPPGGIEHPQDVADVRINGKHLGKDHHELSHGDIICITFPDDSFCVNAQESLVFHYVNLNHCSGNNETMTDALLKRLSPETEPLAVSSRGSVEEIQFLQHRNKEPLAPTPDTLDSTVMEFLFEAETSQKNGSGLHAHTISPSPQMPDSSREWEPSSVPGDSSQGLMCCVSPPSLKSPGGVAHDAEPCAGSKPEPPTSRSQQRMDSSMEQKKSSTPRVITHETVFNPLVEGGLGAFESSWIPEQCCSEDKSGSVGYGGDRGEATDKAIPGAPRGASLPESSQIERSIMRVSPFSDESDARMVGSSRPTVYRHAIFSDSTVLPDSSRPLSMTSFISYPMNSYPGDELTISPWKLKGIRGQHPDAVWETSPRNHASVLQAKLRDLKTENRQHMENLQRPRNFIDSSQRAKTNGIAASSGERHIVDRCLDPFAAEQARTIEELRERVNQLEQLASFKEKEIRVVLRYAEDGGLIGNDNELRFAELHHRIEELISEELSKQDAPTIVGSTFPSDSHSIELAALICVSLRILFNRLKNELYVINHQSLEKMGLILDAVSQYREAQISRSAIELREIVAEVVGRPQRPGVRWSLTAEDVSSGFVNDYRYRAIETLYSLLIWYDTWDLTHDIEHVCGIELIRNADRIIQIARQVRQGDLSRRVTSATVLGLPDVAKQYVRSSTSGLDKGCEKEDKPLQKAVNFAPKIAKSGPHVEPSQALARDSAMGQVAKAKVAEDVGPDPAKTTDLSQLPRGSSRSTSLQSSLLHTSRSTGPTTTAGKPASKRRGRLVTGKRGCAPKNGANICSSANNTQTLPFHKHKPTAPVSGKASKGMGTNNGNLFVRTFTLNSLPPVVPFVRNHTTVPSLGSLSVPIGKGPHR